LTPDIVRMVVVSTMLLPAREAREGVLEKRMDKNNKTFVVVGAFRPMSPCFSILTMLRLTY
jgi:hypothetical protein